MNVVLIYIYLLRHNVLIYVLFLFIYEEKSKISKVFSKTFPKVQYISKNVVPEGIKKELIHVLHRNKTLTRASCSILVSESFCMIYLFAVRLNRNGYWQNEKLLKREKVIIPYYNGLAAFLEVDLTLCSIFKCLSSRIVFNFSYIWNLEMQSLRRREKELPLKFRKKANKLIGKSFF